RRSPVMTLTLTRRVPQPAVTNGRSRRAAAALASVDVLRGVLDTMQTRILVADEHLDLVYANRLALDTLRELEPELYAAFGVRVDDLLNDSIHRFHKNPLQVERILADPTALPRDVEFKFGPVTIQTRISALRP